jgi:deoxycytidylate deaminase
MDRNENISKAWRRGFDAAKAASMHSNAKQLGYRIGAAVYSSGNLLSIGFNTYNKTTPASAGKIGSAGNIFTGNFHAEVSAIIKRKHYENPRNLIIYVSRTIYNSHGKEIDNACSMPCNNCLALIKQAGIRRIRYYDQNGEAQEMKILDK